jgi:uncharacterized membrane protein YeaQ/YmgE (transglycosylase-associated protein family)
VGRSALASAPPVAGRSTISDLIYTVILGAIVGGLGRLVVRGRQNISLVMTIVIGVVAAFVGGYLADKLGVGNTSGIDWIRLLIQVGLAAVGVTLYAGQSGRGRSRRR